MIITLSAQPPSACLLVLQMPFAKTGSWSWKLPWLNGRLSYVTEKPPYLVRFVGSVTGGGGGGAADAIGDLLVSSMGESGISPLPQLPSEGVDNTSVGMVVNIASGVLLETLFLFCLWG